MAGFKIDASEATELMNELKAAKSQMVNEVKKATTDAGRKIQAAARQGAKSQSMPGLSGSIYTKTRQLAGGAEVTVEAKSPFGYIREFGAGRSGPHPFMLPAMEQVLPDWQSDLSDIAGRLSR